MKTGTDRRLVSQVVKVVVWQGSQNISTVGVLKYVEDRTTVADTVQQTM